jgi:hypothetical protein
MLIMKEFFMKNLIMLMKVILIDLNLIIIIKKRIIFLFLIQVHIYLIY